MRIIFYVFDLLCILMILDIILKGFYKREINLSKNPILFTFQESRGYPMAYGLIFI